MALDLLLSLKSLAVLKYLIRCKSRVAEGLIPLLIFE